MRGPQPCEVCALKTADARGFGTFHSSGRQSREQITVHEEGWIRLCELAVYLRLAQIKFKIDWQMI